MDAEKSRFGKTEDIKVVGNLEYLSTNATLQNWGMEKHFKSDEVIDVTHRETLQRGILKLVPEISAGEIPTEVLNYQRIGSHPNLPKVIVNSIHDIRLPGREAKTGFIIEMINGLTLWDLMIANNEGNLALHIGSILDQFKGVADLLDQSASKNQYHLDLKPNNLVCKSLENNKMMIIDWEYAGPSGEEYQGTYDRGDLFNEVYSPPEQIMDLRNKDTFTITPTRHSYALAAMLYSVLTRDYNDSEADSVVKASDYIHNLNESIIDQSGYGVTIDQFFRKALSKNQEDRYSNCTDLVDDLIRITQKHNVRFLKPNLVT